MDEALADWFTKEILPHEAALTRYVGRARALGADPQDVRQEIYIKVLQAAAKARPPQPNYFLFTVARNHLADLARHRRVVPITSLQDHEDSSVLRDEVSAERRVGSFEELQQLVEAFELLPDRCRDVLWLKKVEDLSQKEIARRLGIAEATVEAHLVRGMRMLTEIFYAGDAGRESSTSQWKRSRKWRKSKKPPPRGC